MDQMNELLQLVREMAQKQSEPPVQPPPQPSSEGAERVAAFLENGVRDRSEAKELERQEKVFGRGLLFGRVVRAIANAHLNHDSSPEGPLRILRDRWQDRATAQMMERAMGVGTPSAGGYLVPEVLAADTIPLLYDFAVLLKLGARTVPMPQGNMTLPRITAGSTFSYKPEGAAITSSQPSVGDVKYSAKKLTGNIPIGNELIRALSAEADRIVRDDALEGMGVAMDRAGLLAEGTSDEPLGVLKDPAVTPVLVGAMVDGDTPSRFLTALMNAKVNVFQGGGAFGWAFNPTIWEDLYNLKTTTGQYLFRDEMNRGTLLGFPFGVSTQITNGTVTHKPTRMAFGKWNEYLIARQGVLEVAVSNEASYYDANGILQSAFGKDQTVMRFIDRHDMKLRQAAAMAVSSDVYTE